MIRHLAEDAAVYVGLLALCLAFWAVVLRLIIN
jgi:hypothetical protein